MNKNEENKDVMYKIIQDVYEYIIKIAPLLLCLGFVLFLIQKTVRFAYYEVDHLYLMEIRSEEVLQSLSYLFIFIYIFFFLHDYKLFYKENKKINITFIFTHLIVVFLYVLFLWYTQIYYINFFHVISIFIIIVILSVTIIFAQYIISTKNNKCFSRIKICFIIFSLISAISVIQYIVESNNKRFTYLEKEEKQYIIISTFKDYYITVLSNVENDNITIYRGQVHLFKLDMGIKAHQFTNKIMK